MTTYPKKLIADLYKKYILEDRIPPPDSINIENSKRRWVVFKTIKKDVKNLTKWFQDVNRTETDKNQVNAIVIKLRDLYVDAGIDFKENPNEWGDYLSTLSDIRDWSYGKNKV
jgi:hypothetical protein